MDNFNDPIIQELSKAYLNILSESHPHEELVKLSDSELKELVDEYTKKAAESEGEEKEHHEKELADIKSILASRKDDKEEVKEEAEQIDEISAKTKIAYYLKSKADSKKLGNTLGEVQDEIHDLVQDVASHPDSGMTVDGAHAALPYLPGGEELAKNRAELRAKIAQRKQGQARVEKTTGIKPQNEETRSAKEIVQNISEWMKSMKGKKNGKSK